MNKYALFLGCTVPARSQNYEIATRKVAKILDIELVDIEDFACCGFPIKSTNKEMALLLGARNIAIAEEKVVDICTLCNACTAILTETKKLLDEDYDTKINLNKKLKKINIIYKKGVNIKHFARILYERIDNIKNKITKLLNIKVAIHYGCHYLKPSEIYNKFDNPYSPKSLHKLVEITGAKIIEYENEAVCCGGAIIGVDEKITFAIAGKKLKEIKEADALISICPFCNVVYEDNQRKIGEFFNTEFNIPIIYYPQLLGLALGIEANELGFRLNKIKVDKVLAKI